MMVSLMVSMSSSPCSVSNRFLNSSWNSIFFDPIRVVHTLGVVYCGLYLTFIPTAVTYGSVLININAKQVRITLFRHTPAERKRIRGGSWCLHFSIHKM